MKPLAKAGIVAAGYACALAIAVAVTAARIQANAQNPDAYAAAGMYSFGDSLLFVFTFGVAALPPTGLAFYFLRPAQWFWNTAAACAGALASTNVLAALVYWAERLLPQWSATLDDWSAFAVLRMIVAPLAAAAFFVCAEFTPERRPRRALRIAGACEILASAPWMLWIAIHRFAPH